MLFVDVVVPLNIPGLLTYNVPEIYEENILIGQRVVVELRGHKLYSAIVVNIHNSAPEGYRTKSIIKPAAIFTIRTIKPWVFPVRNSTIPLIIPTVVAAPGFRINEAASISQTTCKPAAHCVVPANPRNDWKKSPIIFIYVLDIPPTAANAAIIIKSCVLK